MVFCVYSTFYNKTNEMISAQVKKLKYRGTWVTQSVKLPTLAQVTISQFVGSSPVSRSVLTARSLEPASDSVSVSLCSSPARALSLKN